MLGILGILGTIVAVEGFRNSYDLLSDAMHQKTEGRVYPENLVLLKKDAIFATIILSHFPTIHYQTTLHSKLNNTYMKQITTLLALSYAGLAMAQQQTTAIMVEAEAASNTLCDLIEDTQYSGNEALRLIEASAHIDFTIELPEGGKYRVYVAGNGIGGQKIVNCTVNGSTGNFALDEYTEVEIGTYIMKTGKNSVTITPAWTWFVVDYLRIESYQDTLAFDLARQFLSPERCKIGTL